MLIMSNNMLNNIRQYNKHTDDSFSIKHITISSFITKNNLTKIISKD